MLAVLSYFQGINYIVCHFHTWKKFVFYMSIFVKKTCTKSNDAILKAPKYFSKTWSGWCCERSFCYYLLLPYNYWHPRKRLYNFPSPCLLNYLHVYYPSPSCQSILLMIRHFILLCPDPLCPAPPTLTAALPFRLPVVSLPHSCPPPLLTLNNQFITSL